MQWIAGFFTIILDESRIGTKGTVMAAWRGFFSGSPFFHGLVVVSTGPGGWNRRMGNHAGDGLRHGTGYMGMEHAQVFSGPSGMVVRIEYLAERAAGVVFTVVGGRSLDDMGRSDSAFHIGRKGPAGILSVQWTGRPSRRSYLHSTREERSFLRMAGQWESAARSHRTQAGGYCGGGPIGGLGSCG